MTRFSVMLPVTDNDGNSNGKIVRRIEYEIAYVTGGITESVIHGLWFDDTGTMFEDSSLLVWTLTDDMNQVHKLESLTSQWCESLKQESLMITIDYNVEVKFVAGKQQLKHVA